MMLLVDVFVDLVPMKESVSPVEEGVIELLLMMKKMRKKRYTHKTDRHTAMKKATWYSTVFQSGSGAYISPPRYVYTS